MSAKPLLIFGLGELAEQAHYYFTQHGGRRVEAFTADAAYATVSQFAGLPVLPFDEAQRRCAPATHELFVAEGNHSYEWNKGPGGYEMLLFHDRAVAR